MEAGEGVSKVIKKSRTKGGEGAEAGQVMPPPPHHHNQMTGNPGEEINAAPPPPYNG